MKRLKYLTIQFCLSTAILQPGSNDRPHNHSPRVVAFSEAIMQGGASIPFIPFWMKYWITST